MCQRPLALLRFFSISSSNYFEITPSMTSKVRTWLQCLSPSLSHAPAHDGAMYSSPSHSIPHALVPPLHDLLLIAPSTASRLTMFSMCLVAPSQPYVRVHHVHAGEHVWPARTGGNVPDAPLVRHAP
jgi:hypothetical protein